MNIIATSEFHPSVEWRVRLSKVEVARGWAVRGLPSNACVGARSECECGFPLVRVEWENADGEEVFVEVEEDSSDRRKLVLRYDFAE